MVRVGVASQVKVDQRQSRPVDASAHDLRRSFRERWASKLMPKELMELLRRESIETTMRFYVGRNARRTASTLWEAYRGDGTLQPSGNSSVTVDEGDMQQTR